MKLSATQSSADAKAPAVPALTDTYGKESEGFFRRAIDSITKALQREKSLSEIAREIKALDCSKSTGAFVGLTYPSNCSRMSQSHSDALILGIPPHRLRSYYR